MFKRARVSLALAVLAGLPAYLGVIHEWELGSKVACGCCFAFSSISFLLGMFEEPSAPVPVKRSQAARFEPSRMDMIRVAP
jgi:hypothetical protein